LLCSAFLFASTELHELLRLPFAVLHFVEHAKETGHYDLLRFLSEHYTEEAETHGHAQEHQKLPFKSCHAPACSAVFCKPTIPEALVSAFVPIELPKQQDYCYSSRYFSNECSDIWQPPKWS